MQHYFDGLDFNDKDLQHSNILINKINTYVFEINPPQNPKIKHLEYLKRIEHILPKIKDSSYRDNVIFSLTSSFVNIDGRVSKLLIDKYIKKMPPAEQNKINLQGILDQIGLTIGETAPNFNFHDLKGHQYTLYNITPKKPYTLLIFWSATCPHCLHAMPKVKKMMAKRQDFNVVAIGLESEKYPWSSEHQYYPDFYHGLKLQKWENPIVKLYGLHATPTFFILNNKNEIIAEPYVVEDLKTWLEAHPDKK
jgi:thiol-disulfide isomerase/thioredoxin